MTYPAGYPTNYTDLLELVDNAAEVAMRDTRDGSMGMMRVIRRAIEEFRKHQQVVAWESYQDLRADAIESGDSDIVAWIDAIRPEPPEGVEIVEPVTRPKFELIAGGAS